MARKRAQQEREASPVAEDFEKDEPLQRTQEEAPTEKPKPVDMVKAAIATGKAMPKDGVAWIKDTYGADMRIGNFSVHKSTIERAGGKRNARTVEKQSRAPRVSNAPGAAAPTTAPASHAANAHMSPSEAARSVKDLVDRPGAAEVRNLVDLFGG
jgi:hypothetical protein